MARSWSAVLARLGVPTGDGRIIDPAGGSSRDLPLPLMWQELSDDGHGGSRVVGRIETLRIADGMVTATGSMLPGIPDAVMLQLEAGVVGPSVDLDDIEYVMDDEERLIITRWRVAGATLVSIPAFADVSLTLDPLPAEPMEVTDGEMADAAWFQLRAAATEQRPPLAWFDQPDLDRLTPITISNTGRIFGHMAGRDTCHVGLPGCVTPPMGYSTYANFHVAAQETQEGVLLPVGILVAGPRHADPQLAFRAAQEHYDDVNARVAKVVVGEDEFGIWVAGWMLPDAKPEAVEIFKSSPVSGDWRWIGGQLELIGVCSVNMPGFPIPRARVAFGVMDPHEKFAKAWHVKGVQKTLIASSGITPVEGEYIEPETNTADTEIARAQLRWALASTED